MKSVGLILVASVATAALPVAKAQRPSQAADVRRYDLLIRPDLESGRLRLTATLDIANPSGNKEFTFSLAAWYDTVVVRSRAGRAAVARTGGVATVRVARATTHERLVFRLSGVPGQSAGDKRPVLGSQTYADRIFRTSADVLDFYASRFGSYAPLMVTS